MGSMVKFRNGILIAAVVIALVAEIFSLFILGFDIDFTIGLAAGTAVSLVNFIIMSICTEISLEKQKPVINLLGSASRFVLYGISFTLTVMHSYTMGAGCAIGFFTIQLAMLYLFAIKPSLARSKNL